MEKNQQPHATQGMTISGGNRNAKNLPVDGDGRDWSHGFFDCCGDFGTCFLACCVPCVVYGRVKKRYEHLEQKGFPDPEPDSCCTNSCFLHCCLTSVLGAGCILQFQNRGRIRERYSIKGGCFGDCMAATCCTPCELVQESRELELEEQSVGHQH